MGRPSNTSERRTQIVGALERVMARHGYTGATIAEIAHEAGLNQGLVHYHFKTKQEILLALIDDIAQALEARYTKRAREVEGDPVAELMAFIEAHLALGADSSPQRVGAWVIIGSEAIAQEAVRAPYAKQLERRVAELARLCRRALQTTRGSTRGARSMASVLACAIEGVFQTSVAAPGVLPAGRAAQGVIETARALLAGVEA